MKVKRLKNKFSPVTITLETMKELVELRDALGNGCTCTKLYNILDDIERGIGLKRFN